MKILQKDFENAIEKTLIKECGYVKATGKNFDKKLGLDKVMLFDFIKRSQSEAWAKYESMYGEQSKKYFLENLVKAISQRGIIDVLRKGFYDRGIKFKLCFFRPETSINREILNLYESNIFSCVKHLQYSAKSSNTLDMVLFLNGIPIVTLELKNQYAVHDASNVKLNCIKERNPNEPIFEFKNRSIVHFAVDLRDVQMTTRLAGRDTKFLPFNQGSNGAGKAGGKGNPDNVNFPTSYLWEKVLEKDMIMEILYKYVYLEKNKVSGKERIIFPIFHQLDVVTKLLNSVKQVGAGKNYLIQHSAGSGKSNSIAWLAHRLSGLHDENDQVIFHSIIVVTDRKILDAHLQETIYQLDHVAGVVERIDDKKKSVGLKYAIDSGKKIIITTLQKFSLSFLDNSGSKKRFAIIVDDSNSSQTGEAASKFKKDLIGSEIHSEEYANYKENFQIDTSENDNDHENKLMDELISHSYRNNLSFFTFTATPKDKTLKLFGEKQNNNSKSGPFHVYSMRQAIEEGFALDVLQNYTTYDIYHDIIKNAANNSVVPIFRHIKTNKAYETLGTQNIKEKTGIMVEHFLSITKGKINGEAKAMLVTSSRMNSIKYFLEFKKYLKRKHINNINVVVALPNGIIDNEDQIEKTYKDGNISKVKSSGIIKENHTKKQLIESYHILIVAERYQTSFNESLLHTLFIDKKLSGIQAVQTLSRVGKICEGKTDNFILDFRNSLKRMQKYFKPFYETNILENKQFLDNIHRINDELSECNIYTNTEVDEFSKVFYKKSSIGFNRIEGSLVYLRPSLNRFSDKTEKEKLHFKQTLETFLRSYSYISQVCGMFSRSMHKTYIFNKFLQKMLFKQEKDRVFLDDEILLECSKLEKHMESNLDIEEDANIISDIDANPKEHLNALINKINEKFGTSVPVAKKAFKQIEAYISSDDDVIYFAQNNDKATFSHIFEKKFNLMATQKYLEGDSFFKKLFEDENFYKFILSDYLEYIYTKVRQ